jgi:hypothetical protein
LVGFHVEIGKLCPIKVKKMNLKKNYNLKNLNHSWKPGQVFHSNRGEMFDSKLIPQIAPSGDYKYLSLI